MSEEDLSLECVKNEESLHQSKDSQEVAMPKPSRHIKLIETQAELKSLKHISPFVQEESDSLPENVVVAIDCEGVPDHLYLIQVATEQCTYIFDCVKLDIKETCAVLKGMLESKYVTKLFHDLHKDAAALSSLGDIQEITGTLDTQLAMELLTGDYAQGFNAMLEYLGKEKHKSKIQMKSRIDDGELFVRRPIDKDVLAYAVDDVRLLLAAKEALFLAIGDESMDIVRRASDQRALTAMDTNGARQVAFNVANDYRLGTYELLAARSPDNMVQPTPLVLSDDTSTLLDLLPNDLSEALQDEDMFGLMEIVLDKGRRPLYWTRGERKFLADEYRLVVEDEIEEIAEKVGGFGHDNRAGLEKQLHRISAIKNRESKIIGLTMRVGRHVSGNSNVITDLLFNDPSKSILFLGEPGSGKTSKSNHQTSFRTGLVHCLILILFSVLLWQLLFEKFAVYLQNVPIFAS